MTTEQADTRGYVPLSADAPHTLAMEQLRRLVEEYDNVD